MWLPWTATDLTCFRRSSSEQASKTVGPTICLPQWYMHNVTRSESHLHLSIGTSACTWTTSPRTIAIPHQSSSVSLTGGLVSRGFGRSWVPEVLVRWRMLDFRWMCFGSLSFAVEDPGAVERSWGPGPGCWDSAGDPPQRAHVRTRRPRREWDDRGCNYSYLRGGSQDGSDATVAKRR